MDPSINQDNALKKAQEAEERAEEGFDLENELNPPEEDGGGMGHFRTFILYVLIMM